MRAQVQSPAWHLGLKDTAYVAAAAPIQSLAWELPYVMGVAKNIEKSLAKFSISYTSHITGAQFYQCFCHHRYQTDTSWYQGPFIGELARTAISA